MKKQENEISFITNTSYLLNVFFKDEILFKDVKSWIKKKNHNANKAKGLVFIKVTLEMTDK